MKVLLVNPPDITVIRHVPSKETFTIGTPLGLAYVAAALEEARCEVHVIDCVGSKLSWDEIRKTLERSAPDIVGVTCTTPTLISALTIARESKVLFPDVPVVLGGHGTFRIEKEILRQVKDVDIIVRGEGERTIVELMQSIEKRRSVEGIRGICFRSESDVITNESRPFIQNLDALPFPARHLLPMESYIHKYFSDIIKKESFKSTVLVSSRGCPFQCVFCAATRFYGRRWRPRSPKNVVDEIEYLYKNYSRYGLNGYWYGDDNFLVSSARVIEICDLLKERSLDHLIWFCQARVDSADPKLYSKMYDAGCRLLELGIESGNEQVLKNIRKGITKDMVRRAVRIAKDVGLKIYGYFMIGLPGDTDETIGDTIKFSEELDLDAVQFNPAFIFPGTEMGREKEIDWLNFVVEEELWARPSSRLHTELHPCVPTYASRERMINILDYITTRQKIRKTNKLSLVFKALKHPRMAVESLINYFTMNANKRRDKRL